jgi:hypothetical protein
MAVEGRHKYRPCIRFDRGADEFFLAHHDAEVCHFESLLGKKRFQDFVPHRVAVVSDYPDYDVIGLPAAVLSLFFVHVPSPFIFLKAL